MKRWVCTDCGEYYPGEPPKPSLNPTFRIGRCQNKKCGSRRKDKGRGEALFEQE